MANRSTRKKKKIPVAVLVALIGLIGTFIAALLSSPIIVKLLTPKEPPPPAVEIVGPDTVPFGQETYFTIVSSNATSARWTIGGFQKNEPEVIEPLPSSLQIFVKPSNNERVGDMFVISVTVYNKNGDTAIATKQFTITDGQSAP